MTREEKKQVLKRYQEIGADIREKTEELAEWRSKAVKVTSVLSDMPRSGGRDNRLERSVERMMEIQSAMKERVSDRIASREEIEGIIDSVAGGSQQRLLRYKYIVGWTWEQIADEMNYTYRNVLYLHGKALDGMILS